MGSRKIVVSPKFEQLREFVTSVPVIFEQQGETIYRDRNWIKVFEVDGVRVNVKRYCVPKFFFNRVVYRHFREPKAVRAYGYALQLREMGIDTPEPIAYILDRGLCMLGYSYFISVQGDYRHDIGDYMVDDECSERELSAEDEALLDKFGRYTATLHERNIYHKDYGNGNVLFNIVDGEPLFTLLDINRMDFSAVSLERGCDNFNRMRFTERGFRVVANAYAEVRGFDAEEVHEAMLRLRESYLRRRKSKLLKALK